MTKRRRRFTAEFKAEAVKFYNENDMSHAEAARHLGISTTSIARWINQAEVDAGKGPTGAFTSVERREPRELRKENRRLRMETEILKKAAAFFAKDVL